MDLLLPPAAPVHLPRRPADSLPFRSPAKTNLSFKKPCQNSSIFFPRLATIARTATGTLVSLHPSTATEAAAAPLRSTRWVVVMERPQNAGSAKSEIVDYYVRTLARVLPSEKEAQMCIYNASWENNFSFCCDIDEESSRELANIPGVVSVRPDKDLESDEKDYSYANLSLAHQSNSGVPASRFSSSGEKCDCWLVRMEKPGVEVVTKAQMVDYFAHILTKVLGNEKDAQVSIYNISWETNFGFCCQIDEDCARELSDVPGVLSVQPDMNVESENKDYKADDRKTKELHDSSETSAVPDVKTKRLFVTGLSFYTSEKTLRAAFEPFGELVEVKIIMDKISKRSKGYAFIEYTTEEAAGAALKEMNGKIINGWMIVVDVAKTNPPKYSRGQSRPPSRSSSSY